MAFFRNILKSPLTAKLASFIPVLGGGISTGLKIAGQVVTKVQQKKEAQREKINLQNKILLSKSDSENWFNFIFY